MDGDGQGVAPRAAVIVGHGIGEGVGQRVPGIQVLHGGQGIVEDVRVGAVGIEGQGTVRARLGDLGREGKDVVWNAVVVLVMRAGSVPVTRVCTSSVTSAVAAATEGLSLTPLMVTVRCWTRFHRGRPSPCR